MMMNRDGADEGINQCVQHGVTHSNTAVSEWKERNETNGAHTHTRLCCAPPFFRCNRHGHPVHLYASTGTARDEHAGVNTAHSIARPQTPPRGWPNRWGTAARRGKTIVPVLSSIRELLYSNLRTRGKDRYISKLRHGT